MEKLNLFFRTINYSIKERKLKDIVLLIISITGINLNIFLARFFPNWDVPTLVFTGLAFSIAWASIALFFGAQGTGRSTRVLTRDSKQEAEYFENWFNQYGEHIMFCNDLDWLNSSTYLKVKEVLLNKGKNLTVYLKDVNNIFVNDLFYRGVKIIKVKKKIISEHNFSIRKGGGSQAIIIRKKELSPDEINKHGTIEVDKYDNFIVLINLALDMLDDCIDYEYTPCSWRFLNSCLSC